MWGRGGGMEWGRTCTVSPEASACPPSNPPTHPPRPAPTLPLAPGGGPAARGDAAAGGAGQGGAGRRAGAPAAQALQAVPEGHLGPRVSSAAETAAPRHLAAPRPAPFEWTMRRVFIKFCAAGHGTASSLGCPQPPPRTNETHARTLGALASLFVSLAPTLLARPHPFLLSFPDCPNTCSPRPHWRRSPAAGVCFCDFLSVCSAAFHPSATCCLLLPCPVCNTR